jgi:hypothetical protein
VGTGEFSSSFLPGGGIVYVNLTGTINHVPNTGWTEIHFITISANIGGGETNNFVFTASFSSKLLPQS